MNAQFKRLQVNVQHHANPSFPIRGIACFFFPKSDHDKLYWQLVHFSANSISNINVDLIFLACSQKVLSVRTCFLLQDLTGHI